MDYVALQVKSSYSLLSSLNDIKKLVSAAKNLGYKSLSITDNNMFGVYEFYKECIANDIKPIIGLEIIINDKKILLYAKNNNGYHNLIKLSTCISENDIDISILDKYKDDLILIMPFSFYNDDIFQMFDDKYIGYSNIDDRAKINNLKVYINDVSYLKKDDYKYLNYLLMIRDGRTSDDFDLNNSKNKHLLSNDEINMLSEPDDIINTMNISNKCNVEINYTNDLLPIYDETIDAYCYLTKLCNKGLQKRLNNNVSNVYQNRLNYELDIIYKMKFTDYFLIVWDYVKYAKQHDILVGPGRGSAAGSLVSYCLGITDVDPIKYNLYFERFLNPNRITMPDIDIDFDAGKIDEVIDYVTSKYGEKKVSGIITFGTLGAKQVIRDVSRTLNINLTLVDEVCNNINEKYLLVAYNNNQRLKRLIDSSNELKKVFEISLKLEGLPKHISMHAAGIVMSNKNLDESIPIIKNDSGKYVTAYSMNYLEELGLLKMDFLSIKNLTLVDAVLKDIRENEKLNITFNNIPLNDKKAISIFTNAWTDEIFQFESNGMKNFLKKLKPTTFNQIVDAIALYRPGPMENIDTYIKRKDGLEKTSYLVHQLESILSETYGIIIYQEQIMQIASKLAGYTLGEADILRRAMSKKKEEVLKNEKTRFIKGCMANEISENKALSIFELILKFANYGFNKSHSVGYALVSYKMAFLKAHFFKYFISNSLTNVIGSISKTKIYLYESRSKDIRIISPNINLSIDKYIVKDNSIICPLSLINNVGSSICNEILKEREKGLFSDFISFCERMYFQLKKKTIINLILAGCFDSFKINKRTLIENLDNVINYVELTKDNSLIKIERPILLEYVEYSKEELIENEFDSYGFYITMHPVSKYKKDNDKSSLNIKDSFNTIITLILHVDRIKEIITKKNDAMAFIDASDEFGSVSLTLFSKVYENFNYVKKNNIIKVTGSVEKRFDKYQVIVSDIEVLE